MIEGSTFSFFNIKPMPIISKKDAATLTSLNQIDWKGWTPMEVATLIFVLQDTHVLLIRKKRGLGKGKINAAGGRIEGQESAKECAIRELNEELCIRVHDPEHIGEIDFQFRDGYSFHLVVFVATQFSGTPMETDEAIPLWFPIDQLPFEEMWADDVFWVPQALQKISFFGRFLFDKDQLLDHWMAPKQHVLSLLRYASD